MPGLNHKGPEGQGLQTGRGNCKKTQHQTSQSENFAPHTGKGLGRRRKKLSDRGFGKCSQKEQNQEKQEITVLSKRTYLAPIL